MRVGQAPFTHSQVSETIVKRFDVARVNHSDSGVVSPITREMAAGMTSTSFACVSIATSIDKCLHKLMRPKRSSGADSRPMAAANSSSPDPAALCQAASTRAADISPANWRPVGTSMPAGYTGAFAPVERRDGGPNSGRTCTPGITPSSAWPIMTALPRIQVDPQASAVVLPIFRGFPSTTTGTSPMLGAHTTGEGDKRE